MLTVLNIKKVFYFFVFLFFLVSFSLGFFVSSYTSEVRNNDAFILLAKARSNQLSLNKELKIIKRKLIESSQLAEKAKFLDFYVNYLLKENDGDKNFDKAHHELVSQINAMRKLEPNFSFSFSTRQSLRKERERVLVQMPIVIELPDITAHMSYYQWEENTYQENVLCAVRFFDDSSYAIPELVAIDERIRD